MVDDNAYHIILSFHQNDAPKLDDKVMATIARNYLDLMGVTNTQYMMVRHIDRDHPHLHIVVNRIDINGKLISDRNERFRSIATIKKLNVKYGLYYGAQRRMSPKRLQKLDVVKYSLARVMIRALNSSTSMNEFLQVLRAHGVESSLSRNATTGRVQGLLLHYQVYTLKSSTVHRELSFNKLNRRFTMRKIPSTSILRQKSYALQLLCRGLKGVPQSEDERRKRRDDEVEEYNLSI